MIAAHTNAPVQHDRGARRNVQRFGNADIPERSGPSITLQREAERLHARGPRPLGELLAEILDGLEPAEAAQLRERIRRYNSIPPNLYRALGADTFPPTPVHSVDGGGT